MNKPEIQLTEQRVREIVRAEIVEWTNKVYFADFSMGAFLLPESQGEDSRAGEIYRAIDAESAVHTPHDAGVS